MTGGAFKNSSNLLSRRREIEEFEKTVVMLKAEMDELEQDVSRVKELRAGHYSAIDEIQQQLREASVLENTARMNIEQVQLRQLESKQRYEEFQKEQASLQAELREINENEESIQLELETSEKLEKDLNAQIEILQTELEQAKATLQKKPELCARLSAAAKAKRIDDRSNHAYRWVALAIMLAGFIALVYGIRSLARKDTSGLYFLLLGLAAIFLFSGLHVFPTAKNNRKAIAKEWQDSIAAMEKALPIGFPVPARYAHPIVLERMIRVLREGRAQTTAEALAQVKEDLKALTADVQVEQEEHDEVVAIKPMFLLQDYQ